MDGKNKRNIKHDKIIKAKMSPTKCINNDNNNQTVIIKNNKKETILTQKKISNNSSPIKVQVKKFNIYRNKKVTGSNLKQYFIKSINSSIKDMNTKSNKSFSSKYNYSKDNKKTKDNVIKPYIVKTYYSSDKDKDKKNTKYQNILVPNIKNKIINISRNDLSKNKIVDSNLVFPNEMNNIHIITHDNNDNTNKVKLYDYKTKDFFGKYYTYNKPKLNYKNSNSCSFVKTGKDKDKKNIKYIRTSLVSNNNIGTINNIPIILNNINNNNYSIIKNNNYKYNHIIEIKLDDLIILEERLNDINIAISNLINIYDGGAAANECIEFYSFYFHSTLKDVLDCFFANKNKIIIKSCVNLKLFVILIIYHLSKNPDILNYLINIIRDIFYLLKKNYYLIIKKIEIYYGEAFISANDIYFNTFNKILQQNNFNNFGEEQIVDKINRYCLTITKNVNQVLAYYLEKHNGFYNLFNNIFSNITKISSDEIYNFFFNYMYTKYIHRPRSNTTINDNSQIIINAEDIKANNNTNRDIPETQTLKTHTQRHYSCHLYNKDSFTNLNNVTQIPTTSRSKKNCNIDEKNIPYIKTPSNKKYTLILDLDGTLVSFNNIDNDNKRHSMYLRPGLFSFLSTIKPFYELITFSSCSKEYTDEIINEIELRKKYFDYNLYIEHTVSYGNCLIKDISRIGRDIKKMIIIDDCSENFRLNKENGIKIVTYNGDNNVNDTVLFELKKLLVNIYKKNYDDLRQAIKDYQDEIQSKISSINNNY